MALPVETASTGSADSLTGILARHVANMNFTALDGVVIHAFRRAMVDYLACAFAGSEMPVTQALRAWAEAEGGASVASVIGAQLRLPASQAAFVNGAAAHALDFDDGYTRGSAHPGGVIFSAAIAAAEKRGAGAEDFIAGVVAGYDVMLRIAGTMHPASAKQGWHNTAVAGVFGAAAAAGRVYGLPAQELQDAFGLAASFAGGIRQYLSDGAEVKRLHPGKAARDGIVCAELAAAGITGAIECLEGADGLFRAMVDGRVDRRSLLADLGQSFLITEAYFKPYPCCRHFHAAIDATLALRDEERLEPDQITAIDIGLYQVGVHGHDHRTANNLLEAQMSAPCAVVGALIQGRLNAAEFEPSSFAGAEPQRLLNVTRVHVDERCEEIYPKVRSGVVTLELTDGRRLERRIVEPRGETADPLTDDDLSRKFMDNVPGHIGEENASRLLEQIWTMDGQSDPSAFFPLLAI
ncbi:MmgE/PrpD family protein [Shinella granuli]|uniref:2-methylcitrate dehydratase PrpD n=1 Tax=Shinella granuli TaxID=323621 RepID=A0A4R2C5A4_SHIGR|nr:MmgE/PrpD family protein [Shinella granuli]TCN35421.1 2-methylcitrate dehydratase PrpD [Shinella granuli]